MSTLKNMGDLLCKLALISCLLMTTACQKTSSRPTGSARNQEATQDSLSDSRDTNTNSQNIGAIIDGNTFFQEKVVQAFQNCQRCHAPDDHPVERNRGPMTIYQYQPMLSMLDQNTFLPMLRGNLENRPHPNRDPCLSGLNSSPCQELAKWWEIEFGDIASKQSERPLSSAGAILAVTADGYINGWAIDPKDLTAQVQVEIAINDPNFNDPIIINANQDVFDNGNPGAHGFQFQLPDTWLDGVRHRLAARIVLGQEILPITITDAPASFIALPKPVAGSQIRQYFTNNVLATMMTDCGCHGNGLTYDFLWLRLIEPFPSEGGSRTNNRLRLKASGGLGHSGGDLCSGTNICQTIESWWAVEFGAR